MSGASVSSTSTRKKKEPPSVCVMVRIRPTDAQDICVEVVEDDLDLLDDAKALQEQQQRKSKRSSVRIKGSENQLFTFDRVFQGPESQESVFIDAGKPIAESALQGYNTSIFAYGQTGSGKTFTMQGTATKSEDRGLIPRMLEFCFCGLDKMKEEGTKVVVHCSYLEIYNEQVYDLLDFKQQEAKNTPGFTLASKAVREDTKRGVFVEGAVEVPLETVQQAFELIQKGAEFRHVGATNMNRESSRSHSIFTLSMEMRSLADSSKGGMEIIRTSRVNLVDLAGSERQRMTKAEGDRLTEAKHINKSLSALGNVISALVEKSKGRVHHVPHRDSVLTYLLRDSLGGNTKTSIIATISPDTSNVQDTLSTLMFAQRAKHIKNVAKANMSMSSDVKALQKEIRRLQIELEKSKTEKPLPSLTSKAQTREESQNAEEETKSSLSDNKDFVRIEKKLPPTKKITSESSTMEQVLRERLSHLEQVLSVLLKEIAESRGEISSLRRQSKEQKELQEVLQDTVAAKDLVLQLCEQKLKSYEGGDPGSFAEDQGVLKDISETVQELELRGEIARLKAENASLMTVCRGRKSNIKPKEEEKFAVLQTQLEALVDDKAGLERMLDSLKRKIKKLEAEPSGQLQEAIERANRLEEQLFLETEKNATGGGHLPLQDGKTSRRASTGDDSVQQQSGDTSPKNASWAVLKVAAEAYRTATELSADQMVNKRLFSQLHDLRKKYKELEEKHRRVSVQMRRSSDADRKQKERLRKSLTETETIADKEQMKTVQLQAQIQDLREKYERQLCNNKELEEGIEMANSINDFKSKQLAASEKEIAQLKAQLEADTNLENTPSDANRSSIASAFTKKTSRDSVQTVRMSTFGESELLKERKNSFGWTGTPKSKATDPDHNEEIVNIPSRPSFIEENSNTPKRSVAEFFPDPGSSAEKSNCLKKPLQRASSVTALSPTGASAFRFSNLLRFSSR